MTTTVLARKYRPTSFEAMVGQRHVVQALANALTQQRLHHAYLFTGTRGVGKTTVSRILAKSLNCVGPQGQGGITARPCGVCQACCDIDAGRFVDYVELDAASNRGVEEISQLLEQAVYKPVVGRFKVYMIDEVHMLSTHAFNAMLKTLEEPPSYLKFVLATTDPQKVPVTVLSRCLQFNLRPMATETVQSHLAEVLNQEGVAHEAASLRLLARAARGSMRDALSLTDQAIAYGGGALMEETVRQMLGAVDRQHVQRLIEAVADGDGAAVVAAVDTVRELGLSAQGTLEELAAALQRMAVVQAVPALASGDAQDPDAGVWSRLALRLAPDETQLFYSLCLQGRAELALAPDEHSGLLMLMLRLLAFKPSGGGPADPKPQGPAKPDNAGPAHRLASGGPSSARPVGIDSANAEAAPARAPEDVQGVPPWDAQAPEPDERPSGPSIDEGPPAWLDGPEADTRAAVHRQPGMSPAAPAGPPSLAPIPHPHAPGEPEHAKAAVAANPLADHWADLVAQMQSRGLVAALVRELAVQSECVSQAVHEGVSHWHLRVERGSLMGDAQRDRLQAAMSQCLAVPVQLVLQQGPAQDTPAQRDLAAREARQRAAEVLIAQDPLVRRLLADHPGARLVPGSVHPMAPVTTSDPDTATITP